MATKKEIRETLKTLNNSKFHVESPSSPQPSPKLGGCFNAHLMR